MRHAQNLDLLRELWLGGRSGRLTLSVPGRADSEVALVRGHLGRGTDPMRVGGAVLLGRVRYASAEVQGEGDAGGTLRLLVACATQLADELEPCCAVTGIFCPTSAGRVGAAHLATPLAGVLRGRPAPAEALLSGGAVTRRQLVALHYLGLARCLDAMDLAPVVVEERAIFHGRGRTAVLQMAANGELHAAEDETGPVRAAPAAAAAEAPAPAAAPVLESAAEPAAEPEADPSAFALVDEEEEADEFSVGTIDTSEHTWSASARQVVELPAAPGGASRERADGDVRP